MSHLHNYVTARTQTFVNHANGAWLTMFSSSISEIVSTAIFIPTSTGRSEKKKKFGGALERAAKHLHGELNMWQNRPYVTSSPSYLKGEEVCLYIITKEILTALSFSTIESEGCVIPCTTYLLYATCTSPIMHLICPSPAKFHITVFHFPWVLQSSQENSKTMLMQNFVGANMVYYGGCASGV